VAVGFFEGFAAEAVGLAAFDTGNDCRLVARRAAKGGFVVVGGDRWRLVAEATT